MAAGSISKRRSHSLGTLRPSIFAGANFQSCAALKARSAKYWLGPGAASDASVTLPDSSTRTFTLRRTLPRMVSLAFCVPSGKICWTTRPRTTPVLDGVAGGVADRAGAGGGAGLLATDSFSMGFGASLTAGGRTVFATGAAGCGVGFAAGFGWTAAGTAGCSAATGAAGRGLGVGPEKLGTTKDAHSAG